MLRNKWVVLSTLLILSGCTSLEPDYQRPDLPVPSYFSVERGLLVEEGVPLDAGWRTFFTDPQLKTIISIALENNLDLKTSLLTVQQSAELFHITTADRYPQVNGAIGANFSEEFKNDTSMTREYDIGMSVSYEIDFFGKLKNMSESDRQNYLASKQAQRTAYIAVISQIAQNYLNYLLINQQIDIANQALNNYQRSFQFIQQSNQAGKSNLLDLEQAKSLVESAKIDIAKRKGQLDTAKHALQLTVGNYDTPEFVNTHLDRYKTRVKLPANLSSHILLQRPDIIEAEHQLLAENANIGAARAAFFPSISLTGNLTNSSTDLAKLFNSSNGLWSFLPKIEIPIFNAGKNKSNLALAEIKNKISVVNYEKKIRIAFKEVSDALSLRDSLQKQITLQQRYLNSLTITAQRANRLYASGAIDYLTVLDTERTLFSAQQTLVELKYNLQLNEITLFVALGGGWVE